jgi:hypothetical protein
MGQEAGLVHSFGMEAQMTQDGNLFAPRKLTHHQARLEQLLYWSRQSIPERLAAATVLTKRMYRMRGIDIDERKADFTPSRVRRRQG